MDEAVALLVERSRGVFGIVVCACLSFYRQKPPMPKARPPLRAAGDITWRSPILMARQASPMAWLDVAQAEQGGEIRARANCNIRKQGPKPCADEHWNH